MAHRCARYKPHRANRCWQCQRASLSLPLALIIARGTDRGLAASASADGARGGWFELRWTHRLWRSSLLGWVRRAARPAMGNRRPAPHWHFLLEACSYPWPPHAR
eukprot:9498310-Pyramimonas_sp.AAC.1